MQYDANVVGSDAGGFRDLFIGEVLKEKGDERFFEWVQSVNSGVKVCDAVVSIFFRWLLRFDGAREIGVLEMNDAVKA